MSYIKTAGYRGVTVQRIDNGVDIRIEAGPTATFFAKDAQALGEALIAAAKAPRFKATTSLAGSPWIAVEGDPMAIGPFPTPEDRDKALEALNA